VKDKAVVFNVPRQVPCHRTAHFSAIEQSERTAQLARVAEEQQRAIEKAREERRLAAKAARLCGSLRRREACEEERKEPRVITASR
jgi:hypothetical protein